MPRFLKIAAGIVAGAGILWLAATGIVAYQIFTPTEYGGRAIREQCAHVFAMEGFQPTDADVIDHAWQDHHWLDSTLRCRMKTPPQRAKAIKAAILASHGRGRSGGWQTTVARTGRDCKGDEFQCPHYGESTAETLPEWWKTNELSDAEWFGVSEQQGGFRVHGVNFVISESRGLVFAQRWKT